MSRVNSRCRAKPIQEYDFKNEATQAAIHAERTYGTKLTPYLCDKCGNWHLSPTNRVTPSVECKFCHKQLYPTRQCAKTRANCIQKDRGVSLSVYQCPCGDGWHLTSK